MRSTVLLVLALVVTLESVAAAQMSGTYTLDPTRPASTVNFQTFAAALARLQSGVSGPVTVLVAPGNYTEQLVLQPIAGSSATNTITFQANNGAVIVTPPFWSQGSVVINNKDAAWFRLVGMRFTGFVTRGIFLDQAKSISVINCTIDDGFHSLARIYSVFVDDSAGIELQNCNVRSTGTPVYLVGTTTKCRIIGCDIDGRGQASRVVGVNRGSSPYDHDHVFEANYIHDCGPAGAGLYFYESSQGNLIVNNTIVVDTVGAAIEVGYNQQSKPNWSTANVLRNNIFVNYGTGSAAHYDIFSASLKINQIDADFNCFFAPNSTRTILVGRSGYPTFAGTLQQFLIAQTKAGALLESGGPARIDANSIEGDPGFTRSTLPYDVHLLSTSRLLDRATTNLVPPYVTLPTWPVGPDYDGDLRDPNPDIGADEEAIAITGASTVKVGGTATAALHAVHDQGRSYLAATSFGKGPLAFGRRRIELGLDALLIASASGNLPGIFRGFAGSLDGTGRGSISIAVPAVAALKGVTLHTAFMTFDAAAPLGVQSLSATWSVLIN